MPRDSLRLQAEEALADPAWRHTLNHAVSVRAADNASNPCRGLQGYITTYQSVGHPAQLDMDDCFAYAVAKTYRTTLLFKGEDFNKTDIPSAMEARGL